MINFVFKSIVHRRRLVTSAYVIKNERYYGNFVLRSYFRWVKIHANNKILLEKVAKNWRNIILSSIENFSLIPLC